MATTRDTNSGTAAPFGIDQVKCIIHNTIASTRPVMSVVDLFLRALYITKIIRDRKTDRDYEVSKTKRDI
ncbi:MAG: hypothetical protein DRJ40_10715 [Thermoprotei archaeon]|nr:MAG: hypothetical protein DRJ40_10715 [Thermoprotei archaeon]